MQADYEEPENSDGLPSLEELIEGPRPPPRHVTSTATIDLTNDMDGKEGEQQEEAQTAREEEPQQEEEKVETAREEEQQQEEEDETMAAALEQARK